MNKSDCFCLGKIVKAHGLKGELKIFIDSDDPSYYKDLKSFFLDVNGLLVPVMIANLQIRSKGKNTVRLKDFPDINTAIGKKIYLPLNFLPKLSEKQFYYHEITGYKVHDKNYGIIGTVTGVLENANQDLLEVEHKGVELLIPISDDVTVSVDRKGEILNVDCPEGLIEMYLGE